MHYCVFNCTQYSEREICCARLVSSHSMKLITRSPDVKTGMIVVAQQVFRFKKRYSIIHAVFVSGDPILFTVKCPHPLISLEPL